MRNTKVCLAKGEACSVRQKEAPCMYPWVDGCADGRMNEKEGRSVCIEPHSNPHKNKVPE